MQPPKSAGKDLILRVRPNYLRAGDWLRQGRHWLGGVAAVLAFGYGAWSWTISPVQLSPGPVASPHAMWDNNCAACHVSFSPTRADSVTWFGDCGRECNAKCQTCHEGKEHHATLTNFKNDPNEKLREFSCAVCHREHQGRDAMLTRADDRACAECHQDLSPWKVNGRKGFDSFPGNHPEFHSIGEGDPGKLKFSHKLHMSLGLTRKTEAQLKAGEQGAKGGLRLDGIREDDQKRYGEKDGFVQLECSSCHDSARRSETAGVMSFDDKSAVEIQSSAGDYMQPINFERHCAACHQNTWSPGIDDKVVNDGMDAAAVLRDTRRVSHEIPHGLDPKTMNDYLRIAVLSDIVNPKSDENGRPLEQKPDRDNERLKETIDLRQVPGRLPQVISTKLNDLREGKLAAAKRDLTHDCAKCHEAASDGRLTDVTTQEIAPVNVPAVWLKYAKFDHSSHRAVSCAECHRPAFEYQTWDRSGSALDHTEMMIPNKATCAKCHAPQTVENGEPRGGARFDCAECHRYHQVDHLPADSDFWRHRFDEKRDVNDFIRGTAPQAIQD